MGNPFVHIELQTGDLAKAKTFYSKLFDWKLEDMPAPGGGMPYTMINVGKGTGACLPTPSPRYPHTGWPMSGWRIVCIHARPVS